MSEDSKTIKRFEVPYNICVDYWDDTDPIERDSTMEMFAYTAQEAYDDVMQLWEDNDSAFFDDDMEVGGVSSLEMDADFDGIKLLK